MARVRHLVASALLLLAGLLLAAPVRAQDQALTLELHQGTLIRLPAPATSVFVANPAIADIQLMSPRLVTVFGKAPGETALMAVGDRDQVLLSRRVTVSHNLSGLNRALRDLVPSAKIAAVSVQGGLVLTGTAASPDEAEQARQVAARFVAEPTDIINRIAISGPTQIHLRVRVAEVSRDVSKQFGINWEAIGRTGDFVFGLARGDDIQFGPGGSVIRPPDVDNLLATFANANVNINVLVDALAEEGLIHVLAEPSLTAKAGETASFLAGGEFPIPFADNDGNIKVEFKEFGVKLAFTPDLGANGRISLNVRPEVSQLSAAGAIRIANLEIPALTTRRAETTVELGSGQSFAVAGLLQHGGNQSVDKFPLLGDLPVLGALFRSSRFQRNETELVIIVTPYLVEPTSGPIPTPLDGFRPADDRDRVLYGRFTDAGTQALKTADPKSPVGFVVE